MRKRMRENAGRVALAMAGAGLAVVAVLAISPAFACTVLAHLEVSSARVDPGAVIRVEGSGFEVTGAPAKVFWGGESGAVLASVPTQNGSFAVDVTIPVNASPGTQYLISATQPGSSPPYQAVAVVRTARLVVAPVPVPAAAAEAVPAQPAPAAAATPSPQPAPAARPVEDPKSAPADASGFAGAGAAAFAPGGQPVAPLVVKQPDAFANPVGAAGGRSPWLLLPLGLAGLGLFSGAGASVVRQTRRQGVRATI